MIIKHKDQCIQKRTTSPKTSFDSHLHWKNHFDKNSSYFRVYANFEADNEIDNSSIVNKTNNIYKQNPVCIGYETKSELEDVLKNGYYKPPLGYEKVDWFVCEIIKLEIRMNFWFKNTMKNIIMTNEVKKMFRIKKFVNFVKNKLEIIKLEIIVT